MAPLLPNEHSPDLDQSMDRVSAEPSLRQPPTPIVETTNVPPSQTYTSDDVGEAAVTLSMMQDAGASGAKRHLVEMLSQEDIDRRVMQKGVRCAESHAMCMGISLMTTKDCLRWAGLFKYQLLDST